MSGCIIVAWLSLSRRYTDITWLSFVHDALMTTESCGLDWFLDSHLLFPLYPQVLIQVLINGSFSLIQLGQSFVTSGCVLIG